MNRRASAKVEMQQMKQVTAAKESTRNPRARRDRKLALQNDVDKLKQKLRNEENLHRALERAFNRPLGALPRLPSYLPPSTLELLAEVAVLEEEVVLLEEQIVRCRQGLYQEAVYTSTSKKNTESSADSSCSSQSSVEFVSPVKTKPATSLPGPVANLLSLLPDDGQGRNRPRGNSVKSDKPAPTQNGNKARKTKKSSGITDQGRAKMREVEEKDLNECSPNKISEDIIRCLSATYLRMSSSGMRASIDSLPTISASRTEGNCQESEFRDPYHICSGFGIRDIGPYKNSFSIDGSTINLNRTSNCLFLIRRLRILLEKLATVKLQGLNHQEKLAFWINIYNSCMMNAFLEHDIPEIPETIVDLMQKATINVGGHSLNAITIEHFILRLPYNPKYISKGTKKDEMKLRNIFGLELSEALVTFALSCGSWSSPAVRVYTASSVEKQLEVAKREYLQAAVGISTRENKLAIPKLLDWYLLDFAKDFESLLDWICLQLPSELGKEALKSLESAKREPVSHLVHVMPYDFSFRYLLQT